MRKWPDVDEQTLRQLYPTGSLTAIRSALPGYSEGSIRQKAAKLGLQREYRMDQVQPYKAELLGDLSELERGYLAGVFDSEGCIGFYNSVRYPNTYRLSAQITNTNWELISWVQDRVPASVRIKRPAAQWRETYWWVIGSDSRAHQFIRELAPYLVAKQSQAKAVANAHLLTLEEKVALCAELKALKRS